MAEENPSWGEERIANELLLKLGIRVDPRTVGKYVRKHRDPRPPVGQRWSTFIHHHANAIVACDFFTSVIATFQVLYVFIAMETGSRRILHCNVTDQPTAEWTRQQFCSFLDGDFGHRYVIHDRDSIFSAEVDKALEGFGMTVLKTPVRSPVANAFCERLIGTIRRECLDYLLQAPLKRSGLNGVGISVPGAIPRSRYLAWLSGPSGKPPNPASRAVTPKADGDEHPQNCNAPLRCLASRTWHALLLGDRSTDATDTGLLGLQQYGCCVDHLYQDDRTHLGLKRGARRSIDPTAT